MAKKPELPGVELEYVLKGQNRQSSTLFVLAGNKYAESRDDVEAFETQILPRKRTLSVKFGRKVLEKTFSHAAIEHEADEMREEIEELISLMGAGGVLANAFAGIHLSGPIPEQE
ncbi:MAG: hypothetical protein JWN28_513 [Candidatus Saccharibacteria bacterium]|nr:hypothetical protein [Candidatus Saccharibacteria bacterium]